MGNRNVTLSLPEEVFRRAKVVAAQRDTSVSALVSEALRQLTDGPTDYDAEWAAEELLMEKGIGLRVGEITWLRDELHAR